MKNLALILPLAVALFGGVALFGDGPILLAQEVPEGGQVDVQFPVGGPEFQPGGEEALGIAVILVAAAIGLVIGLAIAIVIILLISGALKTVPQQFREMEPGMVWLMLIPLFNLVWNFFVFPRVSRSFQRYFAAQGRTEHGDCGEKIGLWTAICWACSVIPCVNYVAGPATLVLLIIYLVKVVGLKKYVTAVT